MAKQPYYHSATILFTATEPLEREAVMILFRDALEYVSKTCRSTQRRDELRLMAHSLDCEEVTNEPGDPADL